MTERARSWIFAKGTGSTVEGIKQSIFRRIPVAFPSSCEEQQAIVDKLDSLEKHTVREQQALQKYGLLKIGLMQDLLTGNVRVKLDEPQETPA